MKPIIIALRVFIFFTILLGIFYPLLITGIAQVFFHSKANGSIIYSRNVPVGSVFIGQSVDSSIYFSSRPSAVNNNPLPSGGSNLGLTSLKLKNEYENRKKKFLTENRIGKNVKVPSEMLFSSASGLDPHISPAAALLQVDRISKARNYSQDQKNRLIRLIHDLTEPPQFLCLGQPRINVLIVNLETDKLDE